MNVIMTGPDMVRAAVIVGREHDGVEIQADTWYELAGGVVREVQR